MAGNNAHRIAMGKTSPLAILSLFAAIIAGLCPLPAQQGDPPAASGGYPAPVGERLTYGIEWDPPWYLFFLPNMHAGEAVLQIAEETEFKGRKVLKIKFEAHSSGTLSKLSGMEVHDEFFFYAEPESFCTLKVSKKIHEGKRKRQIDVEYLQPSGQLHIVDYDMAADPPVLRKDAIKGPIPACVHDPFSALYLLRRQQIERDFVLTSSIGNDDVVKEVQARVEKLEKLDATEGKIPAWRVQAISLLGGLFKNGGQFRVWLSADARRIPLQFEAKVSLGRVYGKLQKYSVENR